MDTRPTFSLEWRDFAACHPDKLAEQKVSPDVFFPYLEPPSAVRQIRQKFCNGCPVWDHCLNWALDRKVTGIWAGLSTADRAAMSRKRTRAKCPVCLVGAPLTVSGVQLCAHCGISWQMDQATEDEASMA